MGSFEKLVVLTVLFLVVLVLGVTLNSGGSDDSGAPGPLHSALLRSEPEPVQKGSFVGDAERESEPLGLLSSTVEDPPTGAGAPAGRPAEPGAGAAGLIVDARGLEMNPVLSDDFRTYQVGAADTWTALSERFYGTRSYSTLLRQANDDLPLTEGESILVPVRDFSSEGGTREPHAPVQRTRTVPVPREEPETASKSAPASPAQPVAGRKVETYTIASGDSLSVISLKVYGTSRRWGEIYEANRDVLADPDTLDVGVVLEIPE